MFGASNLSLGMDFTDQCPFVTDRRPPSDTGSLDVEHAYCQLDRGHWRHHRVPGDAGLFADSSRRYRWVRKENRHV